ncbi:MAG: zinc-binding dehydrogenase [Planctomycetales bacterium]|nr:zinc-binding dehydrogenase [Planctomycetales bacterium]
MRRVILRAPGDLRVEEVPIPEPGPAEVVLRIRAALTCGTDLKTFRRGHPKLPVPGPFGHEYAGQVHSVGAGVHAWRAGDRAVGTPTGPCNECPPCLRGQENLCKTAFDSPAVGAFGEYLLVPARIVRTNLLRVPPGLRDDEAACLDPLAAVVHGQRLLGPLAGRRVAILGAGATGLLHVQAAKVAGAARVVVAGRGADRLALAEKLGADATLDIGESGEGGGAFRVAAVRDLAGPEGPDVVIEAAGRPEAWRLATEVVRPGGEVLLFGGCTTGTQVPMDAEKLHYGEVTVRGAFHYTPRDVRAALDLLVAQKVRAAPLLSVRVGLDGVAGSLAGMAERKVLKAVVIP